MKIGLDFDNTIVCYHQAIAVLAENLKDLAPILPLTKTAIRNFLRTEGRESEWTAFQGELYGPGMRVAKPFDDAIATMQELVKMGHELAIVSHRSRKPYAGKEYDLHEAAKQWVNEHLHKNGLFVERGSEVFFLETREQKIERITELGFKAFVDDLPEILNSATFPRQTCGILFDPSLKSLNRAGCRRIASWRELIGAIEELEE